MHVKINLHKVEFFSAGPSFWCKTYFSRAYGQESMENMFQNRKIKELFVKTIVRQLTRRKDRRQTIFAKENEKDSAGNKKG